MMMILRLTQLMMKKNGVMKKKKKKKKSKQREISKMLMMRNVTTLMNLTLIMRKVMIEVNHFLMEEVMRKSSILTQNINETEKDIITWFRHLLQIIIIMLLRMIQPLQLIAHSAKRETKTISKILNELLQLQQQQQRQQKQTQIRAPERNLSLSFSKKRWQKINKKINQLHPSQ